jgi:hypothetical protein
MILIHILANEVFGIASFYKEVTKSRLMGGYGLDRELIGRSVKILTKMATGCFEHDERWRWLIAHDDQKVTNRLCDEWRRYRPNWPSSEEGGRGEAISVPIRRTALVIYAFLRCRRSNWFQKKMLIKSAQIGGT